MLDHYLIESAYLSELWAVNNITRHLDKSASPELELQLEDEIRHTRILLEAMHQEGYEPKSDNSKSMQEVIYKDWVGIDLEKFTDIDEKHFMFAHEITERRAIWVYRTYIRGGSVDAYKGVCKSIIDDERGHIHQLNPSSHNMVRLMDTDRLIFRKYIPGEYGSVNLLKVPEFWEDYFGDGLKEFY